MKTFFRPAAILFYFLSIIAFFLLGMILAGISGAAENQGLAAGAIIVGYGIGAALLSIPVSILLVRVLMLKTIVKINAALSILIICCVAFFTIRYNNRQKEKEKLEQMEQKPNRQPTAIPVQSIAYHYSESVEQSDNSNQLNQEMGMGIWSPDFENVQTLYFYANPIFFNGNEQNVPIDSLGFAKNKHNQNKITYAPAWFVPEYVKLDYDVLFFKVISIGKNFIEVVGNKTNDKTIHVSRWDGKLVLWPEFLLSVGTVEFIPEMQQPIKTKPLDHASDIQLPDNMAFMTPQVVKGSWLKVYLIDSDLKKIDEGWIRWQLNRKLAISYSLLM